MRAVLLALIFSFTIGCAAQVKVKEFTERYKETKIAENLWQVSFRNDGYTQKERASDFLLYRCAELTLNNGRQYFSIVDESSDIRSSTLKIPSHTSKAGSVQNLANSATYGGGSQILGGQMLNIRKPVITATIKTFLEKPKGLGKIFNPKTIIQSFKKKYMDGLEAAD